MLESGNKTLKRLSHDTQINKEHNIYMTCHY